MRKTLIQVVLVNLNPEHPAPPLIRDRKRRFQRIGIQDAVGLILDMHKSPQQEMFVEPGFPEKDSQADREGVGLIYQEDLLFIGNLAFCFYYPAAVDYVTDSWPFTAGDVVNGLVGVVEIRLEYDSHVLLNFF